jgi:hypothetical protein
MNEVKRDIEFVRSVRANLAGPSDEMLAIYFIGGSSIGR